MATVTTNICLLHFQKKLHSYLKTGLDGFFTGLVRKTNLVIANLAYVQLSVFINWQDFCKIASMAENGNRVNYRPHYDSLHANINLFVYQTRLWYTGLPVSGIQA